MSLANTAPAGTSRRAEIRPSLPPHLFSKTPSRGAHLGITDKTTSHATRDSIWDIPKSQPPPDTVPDAFDGDDLQADDFLVVAGGRSKPKQPTESLGLPFDDLDWLSIDDSPSNSQGASEKPQKQCNNNWTTDLEQHNDDGCGGLEAIRLPNGNWACSHKCKDKTR